MKIDLTLAVLRFQEIVKLRLPASTARVWGMCRAETCKRVRETEAEAVAYVVCEAIGLKADCSADYIQMYSGDKQTLAQSLKHVQRASAEILGAVTPAS